MEESSAQRVLGVKLSEKEHKFLLGFSGFIIAISAFNVAIQWFQGEFIKGVGSLGLIMMILPYVLIHSDFGPIRRLPEDKHQNWLRACLYVGMLLVALSSIVQAIRWLA
ncbi:MAG: hypothetical protein ACK5UX_06605 [Burkholderiales bacterium]|nr:hypothetical protein [Nitrosomonadaceae bacterium]